MLESAATGTKSNRELTDQGHGVEADSSDSTPGLRTAIDISNVFKTKVFEGFQEVVLLPGTADAATPELRILLEMQGNRSVTDDVTDRNTPCRRQHCRKIDDFSVKSLVMGV